MNKKNRQLFVWVGASVFLVALLLGTGCSREQAPPPAPQQSAAPAAPAAPAPGAPAQAPAAPGAPTAANTAQIQVGMTVDQVKQILGNPAEMKQKGQVMEYKYYTPQKFEVKFQNNQVVAVETH